MICARFPKNFVIGSLTQLDVSHNTMGEGGVTLLRDALKDRQGFELKCGECMRMVHDMDSDDEF